MHIVLDSNVLLSDPGLASEKIGLLVEYSQRTESTIFVSEVVLQEVEAHVRRRLEIHVSELTTAAGAIEQLTSHRPGVSSLPDPGQEAIAYIERVRTRYGLRDKQILKPSPDHLPELVRRAANRVKPFNDRGEEFRDAAIWLQILNMGAANKGTTAISFISTNKRDFAGVDGDLHPTLRVEAEAAGLSIQYFASVDGFLKAHAEKIAYITEDFLNKLIDTKDVAEAAASSEQLERGVKRWFRWTHDGDEYVKIIKVVHVFLDDFYVYPRDADWTVMAYYVGELEVEGDVRNYSPDERYGYEYLTVLKYPEISVQVEAIISGRTLKDWNVTEVEVTS